MIISIALPDLGIGKSRLSADVSASATSSTVENNSDFGANDYVLFGKPGNEETEIVLLTSVTGNTTIGHTTGPVFDHPARTPILEIKYNQAKIYRATTEAGEYSLIATTDLTPDEQYTEYDDTAGTSTSWYKIKYYNETTEALSDYSPAVQGTGYTDDALRSMADEVLEEFGDKNENEVSRDLVKNKLKSGVRRIVREIIKNYPEYFLSYTTQALTADTATYDLPARFLAFQRVDVSYDSTTHDDAYKAEFEFESEGLPDDEYQTNDPRVFFRGSTFGLRPTPDNSSGQAWLWYWAYPDEMNDDNDEHGLPYGARDLLVKYALSQLWLPKDREKSGMYWSAFSSELGEYIDFVAQSRQTATTKKVNIVFGSEMYEL